MRREIYVILNNIRSRENVGSIFRTADAAGVKKISLCGITPRPRMKHEVRSPDQRIEDPRLQSNRDMNHELDKISKTALGAEKYVEWEYARQTSRLIEKLKKEGILIIGLEKTKTSKNIFDKKNLPKEGSVALILGNEVKGLDRRILDKCDEVLHIPMYGKKESLNVAVAAGIALYKLKIKD